MTQEGIIRCIRANRTRAANALERAKDEPHRYEEHMALAYRANELAEMWHAELQRNFPTHAPGANT